jgi:hypothetical protein
MKKTLLTLLLTAGFATAYAQGEARDAKNKPAAADKTAAQAPAKAVPAAKTAPAPAPVKKAPRPDAAKAEAARQAEADAEESVVMIDSKADGDETGRFSAAYAAADQEEPAVPGGLPSSYGQLKGVMNEAGRSLLVFESPDDGSITFVQATPGKSGVAWKLIGRIPRSQD